MTCFYTEVDQFSSSLIKHDLKNVMLRSNIQIILLLITTFKTGVILTADSVDSSTLLTLTLALQLTAQAA